MSHTRVGDFATAKLIDEEEHLGQHKSNLRIVKKVRLTSESGNKDPQQYIHEWFMKDVLDPGDAKREVVAQELFRLLIPAVNGQPKTRAVFASKFIGLPYSLAVISKRITGFRVLSYDYATFETMDSFEAKMHYLNINTKLKNGIYHGLGAILTVTLFVNELDAKYCNIGVNQDGLFIKIDGGLCFAHLDDYYRHEGNYAITKECLQQLPFLKDYFAYNWLDAVKCVKLEDDKFVSKKCNPVTIDKEMQTSPAIRGEINRTLLHVLLLPKELIKKFLFGYRISIDRIERNEFEMEIRDRQEQMEKAAMQLDDFRDYLQSETAKQDVSNFIEHLKKFKMMHNKGHALSILEKRMIKDPLGMHSNEKAIHAKFAQLRQRVVEEKAIKTLSRRHSGFFAATCATADTTSFTVKTQDDIKVSFRTTK